MRRGLPIMAGTDQAVPGYSLHRELELYVEAGMTPMEAIQAATTVPARAMGLSDRVGTVRAGQRADLLLVDADPLADIKATRQVWRTIAAGAVVPAGAAVAQCGVHAVVRTSPKLFERTRRDERESETESRTEEQSRISKTKGRQDDETGRQNRTAKEDKTEEETTGQAEQRERFVLRCCLKQCDAA